MKTIFTAILMVFAGSIAAAQIRPPEHRGKRVQELRRLRVFAWAAATRKRFSADKTVSKP